MGAMLAADAFSGGVDTFDVAPFGRGHIHRSFSVVFRDGRRILLQRINESVFHDPAAMMGNISAIADFAGRRLEVEGASHPRRRFLTPLCSDAGSYLWKGDGGLWRAYHYIDGTTADDEVNEERVGGAARVFGEFHRLLEGYDGRSLATTIPHFHNTPWRLDALEEAAAADPLGRRSACADEVARALAYRSLAPALLELQDHGVLPTRVVHNDAKLDNVLFDIDSGAALCVVDLDTVMPGVLAFDFGDMVRSMTSGLPEDALDLERLAVREDLFESLVRGYLCSTSRLLVEAELSSLVLGGQVITLEQGARFLTDHLLGDAYYPCARDDHNLHRARAQLHLLDSLVDAGDRLEEIVRACALEAPGAL